MIKKLIIVAIFTSILVACKSNESDSAEFTYPIPTYCESTVKTYFQSIGLQTRGIDFQFKNFDLVTNSSGLSGYGVISGKGVSVKDIKLLARSSLDNCSPDSQKYFDLNHPIVLMIEKETGLKLNELRNGDVRVTLGKDGMIVRFSDPYNGKSTERSK